MPLPVFAAAVCCTQPARPAKRKRIISAPRRRKKRAVSKTERRQAAPLDARQGLVRLPPGHISDMPKPATCSMGDALHASSPLATCGEAVPAAWMRHQVEPTKYRDKAFSSRDAQGSLTEAPRKLAEVPVTRPGHSAGSLPDPLEELLQLQRDGCKVSWPSTMVGQERHHAVSQQAVCGRACQQQGASIHGACTTAHVHLQQYLPDDAERGLAASQDELDRHGRLGAPAD